MTKKMITRQQADALIEREFEFMRAEFDKLDAGDPAINAEMRAFVDEKINDALASYYIMIDQYFRRRQR